ncbi:TPA: ADP-ribosyltransferase [Bacillus cereus]
MLKKTQKGILTLAFMVGVPCLPTDVFASADSIPHQGQEKNNDSEILNREKRSSKANKLKQKLKQRFNKKYSESNEQVFATVFERGISEDDVINTLAYGTKYDDPQDNYIIYHLPLTGLVVKERYDDNKKEYIIKDIESNVVQANLRWRKIGVSKTNDVLDFMDKETEAKIYGAMLSNNRENIVLTKRETEAFNNYEMNGTRINQALRDGKVDGYNKEYVRIAKDYASMMDSVFKKNDAQLPNSIKVYRYTDEKQFGLDKNNFFPEGKVNMIGIEQFKKKFEGKVLSNKGFTSTSLAIVDKYLGGHEKTVRMDIKIPKGAHTVYMQNEYAELVLPRDSKFKINKVSGIIEKDKLIMKVDAELI